MKSKYVIIEASGMEVPLIFSRFLLHEEVIVANGRQRVRAAGFCELDANGKWLTSGHSVSLELGARPQDAQILNDHTSASGVRHQSTEPTIHPVGG